MMRALFAGVSGLKEHQTMIDVVGNNIANVNTVGFKAGRLTMEEMISQMERGASGPIDGFGGVDPKQVGLGVKGATIDTIFTQGNLQTTGVLTDLAIQGNGFFILRQGNDNKLYYTRNGAFSIDAANQLVNPGTGMKVQGWMADSSGVINSSMPVTDIVIPVGELMTARATDLANYVGNLNSEAPIGAGSTYINTLQVYDSLGNSHLITMTFEKTGVNQWQWTAAGNGIVVGAFNQGTLTFGADGSLLSQTGSIQIDVATSGAANPLDITLDFSLVTQFATTTTITVGGQNGYPPGVLESFNMSQDGIITGIYSNGATRPIARIALASFRNPSGLLKTGDSMFIESPNSGIPQIGNALTGSRGAIIFGTLEMSNVDLAKEFTNMIIGQRGFQANSKIITTADEMLNILVNLKR